LDLRDRSRDVFVVLVTTRRGRRVSITPGRFTNLNGQTVVIGATAGLVDHSNVSSPSPRRALRLLLVAVTISAVARATSIHTHDAVRTRKLLDADWRFEKGESDAVTAELRYQPFAATRQSDSGPADAEAIQVHKQNADAGVGIKRWILPTGNSLIKDRARRFAVPANEWSGNIPYVKADMDDSKWSQVNLPHDWAIGGPWITEGPHGGMGRLPSAGIGWYRKKVAVPATDAAKRVFLEIEGAMSYAAVWCNGHLVGGWPYGYTSWQVDLTRYVKFGAENQLAIRLDNPDDSSRWYPGGGIYRHVWLTTMNSVHFAPWGTRVTTRDVSAKAATVDVETRVVNEGSEAVTVKVSTTLLELPEASESRAGFSPPSGKPAAGGGRAPRKDAAFGDPMDITLAPGEEKTIHATATVMHPRLWGPPPSQQPNRYRVLTRLLKGIDAIDEDDVTVGVRDVRFDPGVGVVVNGERIRIQGVNQHHDLGALGAAFNVSAARRQLELLREMGCNAVRMSHNPPAPELLDLCDEMGFLVFDEAFDCWVRGKTPNDFHLTFPEWHEQDLRALVRRDRNHPSVIVWSVGNEVGEQYTGAEGAAVAKELCTIVHEEDPTRPTTSAMNYAKPDMPMPAELDLISLNYQGEGIRQDPQFEGTKRIRTPPLYDAFHAKFPAKVVLSSETASAFSSRGVYLFPVASRSSAPVRDGEGGDPATHQVSSYELYAVEFGSSADKVFAAQDAHGFVAGEFVWTGWDYLGEPTPYYSARSSYCGIIDLAGFKKDRFYLYQSRWRPDLPRAHILPHWTWPERIGQVTPVHVFTSADEAELFLNEKSLGRKTKQPGEYRLRWDDVVYEPGALKVVAYKAGKEWATDVVRTAGPPAAVVLETSTRPLVANGTDLGFVSARIVDAHGVTVPRAENVISFAIDGGEVVATDNGDPTSFEPFTSPRRRAFSGQCLAIVRTKHDHVGSVHVTASSDGLKADTVEIATQ